MSIAIPAVLALFVYHFRLLSDTIDVRRPVLIVSSLILAQFISIDTSYMIMAAMVLIAAMASQSEYHFDRRSYFLIAYAVVVPTAIFLFFTIILGSKSTPDALAIFFLAIIIDATYRKVSDYTSFVGIMIIYVIMFIMWIVLSISNDGNFLNINLIDDDKLTILSNVAVSLLIGALSAIAVRIGIVYLCQNLSHKNVSAHLIFLLMAGFVVSIAFIPVEYWMVSSIIYGLFVSNLRGAWSTDIIVYRITNDISDNISIIAQTIIYVGFFGIIEFDLSVISWSILVSVVLIKTFVYLLMSFVYHSYRGSINHVAEMFLSQWFGPISLGLMVMMFDPSQLILNNIMAIMFIGIVLNLGFDSIKWFLNR
ncbi:MAG: hypothetical protein WC284_14680 [Candidimonas sp.]